MRNELVQDLNYVTRRLGVRPDPPRPRSLEDGVLLWSPPAIASNVTHTRIYNTFGQMFAEVPVGQTKLVGYDETKAFLASYDSRSGLESKQAPVVGTVSSAGATAPIRYALSASSTNITSPGTGSYDGERRLVIINTDGTAGRLIVWNAVFKGVNANDFQNDANWTNVYEFFWNEPTLEWWLLGSRHYATP